MQKILCPFHEERTPSCAVYEDGFHCYGCGRRGTLAELGKLDFAPTAKKPPSNLSEELAYIAGLPKAEVRGLQLPVDQEGYYIVWPDGLFWKKRRWLGENNNKYVNPRGHKKPMFVPHTPKDATALVLVEGELNALSLASIDPPFVVASPGSASDFNEKCIAFCTTYLTTHVKHLILDKDKAGLEAAIKMKAALLKVTPYVRVTLLEKDCNELLMSGELQDAAKDWGKA